MNEQFIDVNFSRKSNGMGTHDQIIHFINGEKRYIQGILYIWENEMIHMIDYLGVEYIVNKQNVLFTERMSRKGDADGDSKKFGKGKSSISRDRGKKEHTV